MPEDHPTAGWYRSDDDPPGTHRYWDGGHWVGEPQPLPPQVTDPAPVLGYPLGTPWQRIAAQLTDVAILYGATILVRALVDDEIAWSRASTTSALIMFVVTIGHEVAMVASIGATAGKILLGLRVVDTQGHYPPGPAAAARRWIPKLVLLVPFVGIPLAMAIVLASMIYLFSDPGRRSVFDRVGGTYVISVR